MKPNVMKREMVGQEGVTESQDSHRPNLSRSTPARVFAGAFGCGALRPSCCRGHVGSLGMRSQTAAAAPQPRPKVTSRLHLSLSTAFILVIFLFHVKRMSELYTFHA